VFIVDHYIAFAVVRRTFSSAYPDEVQNKTTIHRLVTTFLGTYEMFVTDVHRATKQLKFRLYLQ
jgi:hypothetical protein